MRDLASLEKQQVGLRVPKYLLDEVDEFTRMFSVNRSEVIIEAIKSYVEEQKSNIFYKSSSCGRFEYEDLEDSKNQRTLLQCSLMVK